MHSSLSSVAQFWQAALVGRERLVGGDVGHLLVTLARRAEFIFDVVFDADDPPLTV